MKTIRILALLSLSAAMLSCSAPDPVHTDFETRREALGRPELYAVFDSAMTADERHAMEFLYAYMPLPDMTDYSGSYYLDNVRTSLTARREMAWGDSVPDREWLHFVLPVRVNNENLDSCRMVFYDMLKERVSGLSMSDAILEINHWCHEKVTYRPSDARTSSPLATMRTAHGRCGEESTFTVAALRAMGIPARQVYTPRWAHSDDNHAWVEAWAGGRWHFLGACEPEAILDLGWFNAPASRGMMMNTNVPGRYDGPEEQLGRNDCYTRINVTANYAPVATSTVTVTDTAGIPVPEALVEFKLYNYGEFYTIAAKKSDGRGQAKLTTGLGDMLVWASHDGAFGCARLTSVPAGGTATVVLDMNPSTTLSREWDMVPPPQSATLPVPTPEQAAANSRRLATEDSIRNAYTATFVSGNSLTARAEGNHAVIARFLSDNAGDTMATAMLEALAEKDLKDITPDVLADHFEAPRLDYRGYVDYVLNPRIANEMLTPWRRPLSVALANRFDSPEAWIAWCADSIAVDTDQNPQSLRMNPVSALRHRITDAGSRDILFVAGARAMGIRARIDPVTGKPQWMSAGSDTWMDVDFENAATAINAPQGTLRLQYDRKGKPDDPAYYYHFTLSRIDGGSPALLNYPDNSPLSAAFTPTVTLDAGQYLLTTGQRLADGTVLTHMTIFEIRQGEETAVPLIMRHDDSRVQVIGSFNSEDIYHDLATGTDRSILSTTGRGYYVLALVRPNHEPTVHFLNDLSLYSRQLEQWGGKILLLFADGASAGRFSFQAFSNLPSNVVWGTDIDGRIETELKDNLHLDTAEKPLVIIADTFNRVVSLSQGYAIGQGEHLNSTLSAVGH